MALDNRAGSGPQAGEGAPPAACESDLVPVPSDGASKRQVGGGCPAGPRVVSPPPPSTPPPHEFPAWMDRPCLTGLGTYSRRGSLKTFFWKSPWNRLPLPGTADGKGTDWRRRLVSRRKIPQSRRHVRVP